MRRRSRASRAAFHHGKGTARCRHGNAERIEHAMLGARKAASHQHQLRRDLPLRALDRRRLARRPIERMNLKPAHVPVAIQEHALRVSAPFTQVIALKRNSLLLAVIGLLHVGPLGPRIGGRTHLGRAGAVFQLAHRARTLAHCRAHAVVARVAAADDDDVFALGADSRLAALEQRARLLGEIIDRVDHVTRGEAFLEAFGANTACRTRARRHDNRVEFLGKPHSHRGIGRVGVQAKLDAKLCHKLDTARDHRLLELHVGDTVHEKAARTVVALDHRDAGAAAR